MERRAYRRRDAYPRRRIAFANGRRAGRFRRGRDLRRRIPLQHRRKPAAARRPQVRGQRRRRHVRLSRTARGCAMTC